MTGDELDDLGIAATYYRDYIAALDEQHEPGRPYPFLPGELRRIVGLLHNAYLEVRRLTTVETELRAELQRLQQITRHTAG